MHALLLLLLTSAMADESSTEFEQLNDIVNQYWDGSSRDSIEQILAPYKTGELSLYDSYHEIALFEQNRSNGLIVDTSFARFTIALMEADIATIPNRLFNVTADFVSPSVFSQIEIADSITDQLWHNIAAQRSLYQVLREDSTSVWVSRHIPPEYRLVAFRNRALGVPTDTSIYPRDSVEFWAIAGDSILRRAYIDNSIETFDELSTLEKFKVIDVFGYIGTDETMKFCLSQFSSSESNVLSLGHSPFNGHRVRSIRKQILHALAYNHPVSPVVDYFKNFPGDELQYEWIYPERLPEDEGKEFLDTDSTWLKEYIRIGMRAKQGNCPDTMTNNTYHQMITIADWASETYGVPVTVPTLNNCDHPYVEIRKRGLGTDQ